MIKHSEVQSLFSIYAAAKVESENTNSEFNQWVKANKPPTGIPFTSDIHQLILKGRWNLFESQRRQKTERLQATQSNMFLAKKRLCRLVRLSLFQFFARSLKCLPCLPYNENLKAVSAGFLEIRPHPSRGFPEPLPSVYNQKPLSVLRWQ